MEVKDAIIFTFMGYQPMAVKNSILIMLFTNEYIIPSKIILGFTERSFENFEEKHGDPVEWMLNNLVEGKKRMSLTNVLPSQIKIIPIMLTEENDIPNIKEQVTKKILENTDDHSNTIILDITPGRKTMSVAGFLSAYELSKKLKNYKVFLHYYWFKSSITQKQKERHAWEIYSDEYKSRMWSPEELL